MAGNRAGRRQRPGPALLGELAHQVGEKRGRHGRAILSNDNGSKRLAPGPVPKGKETRNRTPVARQPRLTGGAFHQLDRKRVVWGKRGSVRVDPGGRRTIKKKK